MEVGVILQVYAMLLLIGLPALTTRDAGRVDAIDRAGEFRRAIYVSVALSLLLVAAATLGVAVWQDVPGRAVGWTVTDAGSALAWASGATLAGLLVIGGVSLLARRVGWREGPIARLLMPRSPAEKRAFLVLAGVGAACEEYVYRGFLLWLVATWSGSIGVAVLITSLSFGLAHGYQRVPGILRATLLGALLAAPVLVTGSLFASVVAHFWINAAIGLGGWKWLVGEEESSEA